MGAQLVIAQSKSKHSNLFSIENSIPETIDSVNLQAFFGRATSFQVRRFRNIIVKLIFSSIFQYPNSCQKLLKPLAAFQSAYFEYFCSNNCTISKAARFTSSLISNLTHPEKLAEKSAKQLKSTNVAYAKKHMNAIDMLMRLQLFPSSCFRTKIYRKILVPLNLDSNCESETKITFMTCRLYTPRSTRAETPSGLIFHGKFIYILMALYVLNLLSFISLSFLKCKVVDGSIRIQNFVSFMMIIINFNFNFIFFRKSFTNFQ